MIEGMPGISRKPRGGDLLFVAAVVLLVAGAWLLPVTAWGSDRPWRLWPLLLVGAGAIWLYMAVSRRASASAVFGGTALGLGGAIVLAGELLGWPLSRSWPLFSVAIGLALLPAGASRYRHPRASFLVPALSFIAIGGFFALFSFRLSTMPFRAFVAAYWPLSFVVGALALFAAYFLRLPRGGKRRGRDDPR
jgi:hypothetical protein